MAQADGLVVFCQNSRLIDRYRDEIARAPERASNYYRLARAAEAIGREDTALESYREAIDKARPDESIDGIPLAGAARDHLFRLLMRQAGRSRHERRWDVAIHQLESAAELCPDGRRTARGAAVALRDPPRCLAPARGRRRARADPARRPPPALARRRWTTAAGPSAPT